MLIGKKEVTSLFTFEMIELIKKHVYFMKKIFFITLVISSCIHAFAFHGGSICVNARNHFHYFDAYNAGMAFLRPDTVVPVKIQLEKTSFNDMAILFISDTAKQIQDMGSVLSKGYSELMKYVQENQLRSKKFLAWYYSAQPPWIMDIAVETDKLPSELRGRIKSRIAKRRRGLDCTYVGSL